MATADCPQLRRLAAAGRLLVCVLDKEQAPHTFFQRAVASDLEALHAAVASGLHTAAEGQRAVTDGLMRLECRLDLLLGQSARGVLPTAVDAGANPPLAVAPLTSPVSGGVVRAAASAMPPTAALQARVDLLSAGQALAPGTTGHGAGTSPGFAMASPQNAAATLSNAVPAMLQSTPAGALLAPAATRSMGRRNCSNMSCPNAAAHKCLKGFCRVCCATSSGIGVSCPTSGCSYIPNR